jgi:hypothetical protein
MNESKASKRYLVWTVLAVACVLFDVGLFVALGSAVKWLAGIASPFVWAGLAVVAVVGARLLKLLDGVQLIRQERSQA